jgi:hypothetical protein
VKSSFKLAEQFPDFAREVSSLLREEDEEELAATVSQFDIVDRCRCGDDFCATMYTVRPPRDGWGRTHPKEGLLVLDVLDQEITGIEALFRNEVREKLLMLLP